MTEMINLAAWFLSPWNVGGGRSGRLWNAGLEKLLHVVNRPSWSVHVGA